MTVKELRKLLDKCKDNSIVTFKTSTGGIREVEDVVEKKSSGIVELS